MEVHDPIAFVLPIDTPDAVLHGIMASIYHRATGSLGDLSRWASYSYEQALQGEPVQFSRGIEVEENQTTYSALGDKVELIARRVKEFNVDEDGENEIVTWKDQDGTSHKITRKSQHVDLYRG